jgi:hypothetical protein
VVRRAEGYSSGMSVGDATFSGRLAGRQAALAMRRSESTPNATESPVADALAVDGG